MLGMPSKQRLGGRYVAAFVALTVIYYLLADWGLRWSMLPGAVTPVYPAAGVAVAGLLLGGLHLWPAIVLGRLLAFWLGDSPPPEWSVQISIAFGTAMAGLAAAWGLSRIAQIRFDVARLRDMLWLVLWGSMLTPIIGASIGVAALALSHRIQPEDILVKWVNWWLGNMTGVLVVTPFILAWFKGGPLPRVRLYWLHLIFCTLAAATFTWGVFKPGGFLLFRSWLIFPILMWAAIVFHVRGAVTAMLVVALLAVWGTSVGGGMPVMQTMDPKMNFILLQQFVAVAAISSLVLAVVADERKGKEALLESEERYRVLTELAPEAVWMSDGSGSMIYCNEWWTELTGLTLNQSRHGQWLQVVHPDYRENVEKLFTKTVADQDEYEIEMPLLRISDGKYRWHLARGKPLKNSAGLVTRWIGTAFDIHDRKQAEVQREDVIDAERAARTEAERVGRMKDEFLATLSHELRTPLNAILGWSQLLSGGDNDPDELKQGLETIDRNARVQAQLIEDLLDMSRIISGKVRLEVQQVDLAAVVDAALNTVRLAAQAKEIRLVKAFGTQSSYVSGDPGRLQQVVWNLLSNAIKFTPSGETVEVLLERHNKGYIEIRVADTGAGIKKEFLPYVFDQFRQADASTTRAHGGLGLGLAIVKSLVELHGGVVAVESEGPGLGSTFTVRLPTMRSEALPLAEAASQPARALRSGNMKAQRPHLPGLKVLVIDDEADARDLVRRMLSECDMEVVTAGSATEAIDLGTADRPDVIVSDISMPDMDGYELILHMRTLGWTQPAIALTAFAREEDRHRALDAGYQLHIAKPVDAMELIKAVARLCGKVVG